MSVSILEVLNAAGYDVQNDIDDARWLLEQVDEFDKLREEAENLDDLHRDYEDSVEMMEEDGVHGIPSFDEWRKDL